MTLAQIILLAVNASMFLIVFALGLETTLGDATSLFRQPGLFVRSILAMNIIMLGGGRRGCDCPGARRRFVAGPDFRD
jgi:hypothetical protein